MARKNSRIVGASQNSRVARSQGYQKRSVATREERKRFLIVCEGKKTEPNYFIGFRNPRADISVHGTGANTRGVVEQAITLRDAVAKSADAYDRVWCVFDRDSFPANKFNAALQLAQCEGINVAYSNEAFEIWYLLHFDYHDAAMSRYAYKDKLTQLLNHEYLKNSTNMYAELYSRQSDAITNAKRLHSGYKPCCPEKDNPSTTVYLLVEELRNI